MNYRRIGIPLLSLIIATLACVQDCIGTDFSIKGQVIDEAGEYVSGAIIHAYGEKCFEAKAFDLLAASDDDGRFETKEIFRFACCEFDVEVSAEGHETQSFIFSPPGEQAPNELPEELSIVLLSDEPESHEKEGPQ